MGDVSGPPPKELTSWKEIADYLGVNLRTAQKWERERGLPVRRLPGGKGRVSASPAELDGWRARTTENPRWWNSLRVVRYYAAGITLVAVVALAVLVREAVSRATAGPPALFRTEYATLTVQDASGRALWKHTFQEPLSVAAYDGAPGQQRIWFGDLEGDGSVETLFVEFPARAVVGDFVGTALLCFAQDGALKWRFEAGKTVTDAGGATYSPHYHIAGFSVVDLETGRGRMIAATTRHPVHYPTRFVLLDPRGRLEGEYWHSGHLDYMQFLDLDGDGVKEVLLAGVNNGRRSATLVVLDPRNFTGASDQGPSPYQIRGYPAGKEKAVVFFQRTCVNRKLALYNMARMITPLGDRFRVAVFENLGDGGDGEIVLYTMERTLEPVLVQVSDGLRMAHEKHRTAGVLDHRLTEQEIQALRQVRIYRAGESPVMAAE